MWFRFYAVPMPVRYLLNLCWKPIRPYWDAAFRLSILAGEPDGGHLTPDVQAPVSCPMVLGERTKSTAFLRCRCETRCFHLPDQGILRPAILYQRSDASVPRTGVPLLALFLIQISLKRHTYTVWATESHTAQQQIWISDAVLNGFSSSCIISTVCAWLATPSMHPIHWALRMGGLFFFRIVPCGAS